MPRFVNHIAQGLITRLIRGNWFDLSSRLYTDSFMFSVLPQRKNHLWIIAAPKSGSTWLSVMLEDLLGWPQMRLVPAYERREQELDLPSFFSQPPDAPSVFSPHQHCRRSDRTLDILQKTGMKAVLTTRNIFDTVYSYRDHMEKTSVAGPAQFINRESWQQLSEDEKLEWVVNLVVPWYFNFYAGWFDYLTQHPEMSQSIRPQSYDDLLADPAGSLQAICSWAGITVSEEDCQQTAKAAESKSTNRNVAIKGRGQNLADQHVQRIRRMAELYPTIDFSPIGL